jgi:hypothetical protein
MGAFSSSAAAATTTDLSGCENYPNQLPSSSCLAAGVIRNVSLWNLQGAAQFCNWKKSNPGEWSRIQDYAKTGTAPANIITWFGGHIYNDIQAYFAAGGPTFTIEPNTAPNICKTPLAPPKASVVGVTDTAATVTITTP